MKRVEEARELTPKPVNKTCYSKEYMTSILNEKVKKKIIVGGKTRSCRLGKYKAKF